MSFNRKEIELEKQKNECEYISNYLSLEITEYFFNIITDKNIHIDLFLSEFRDVLKNVIHQILKNNDKEKMIICHVFNYYSLIVNIKSDEKIKNYETLFIDSENNENKNSQHVLDMFFSKKNNFNKVINVEYKDIEILLMPLSSLDRIIKQDFI